MKRSLNVRRDRGRLSYAEAGSTCGQMEEAVYSSWSVLVAPKCSQSAVRRGAIRSKSFDAAAKPS